ncbi:MAG: CopG family transcriptional regulator [Sinimarinibacterium flocculans]|uniref:ribbon-helix-helix domain-containing protein n=1 Tax=Sinimarinibacterium flocculans TaxID=985250 RepID=UPI003C4D1A02
MSASRSSGRQPEAETIRASISFPAGDYAELERLAATMKVSLAWVVRRAIEEYLAKQQRRSTPDNREG